MFLGLDIGGTYTKFGIFDNTFNIIEKGIEKTNTQSINEFFNTINDIVSKYSTKYFIEAIGCAVPGIIHEQKNIKISPNIPILNNINLNAEFAKFTNISVAIDNDANAAGLAELNFGKGLVYSHFIFVTLGTGIGGAIIIDNNIYRGANGVAGEIGHTLFNINSFPEMNIIYKECILEKFVNRLDLIANAKLITEKSNLIPLSEKQKDLLDVNDIIQFANEGKYEFIHIIQKFGEKLSFGLISAMHLLDINTVILGGGIAQSGEILLDSISTSIKKNALPHIAENFNILASEFGNDAGILGAAILAKSIKKS